MKRLLCLFFGHKDNGFKYTDGSGIFIRYTDLLCNELLTFKVCERCGAIYEVKYNKQ